VSYCRIGDDSDVYVYQDVDFGLRCMCRGFFDTRSRRKMIEHLEAHRESGMLVPKRVLGMLWVEIDTEGDDAPGRMHTG
jgi:hypothetical protein